MSPSFARCHTVVKQAEPLSVYTTYTASRAVGIAVITAVMGCSSSEDETLRRVGFKRDKRFLVSGSEEECLEIRRSKGLRKKSSGNNQCTLQCGTAVWDEDKEKTSSEDETPKRGRFRKAQIPSKKE